MRPGHTYNHCSGFSDEMWKAIADSGAAVNLVPRSDSQYGLGGFTPVLEANRHGIQEGISSDNELSYGHDLFTEMRTLLTVQRGLSFAAEYAGDADVPRRYGVEDVLRAATVGGAINAGLQDEIGTIEVGRKADLVLIALDEVTTRLCGSDIATVVNYGGRGGRRHGVHRREGQEVGRRARWRRLRPAGSRRRGVASVPRRALRRDDGGRSRRSLTPSRDQAGETNEPGRHPDPLMLAALAADTPLLRSGFPPGSLSVAVCPPAMGELTRCASTRFPTRTTSAAATGGSVPSSGAISPATFSDLCGLQKGLGGLQIPRRLDALHSGCRAR
jgi:amidohydrolase family protein